MTDKQRDPGTVTAPPGSKEQGREYAEYLGEKLGEINSGIEEYHRMLTRYADTVEGEGLREQLETLESWMRQNAENMALSVKIFELGPVWLGELHQRLSLATEELGRLESEGGGVEPAPAAKEPAENEKLQQICRSADNVLQSMSELFAGRDKSASH